MSGKVMSALNSPFIFLSMMLWCASAVCAQTNSRITASVLPSTVTVGDSVSYQISVELTGAGQPSIALPVLSADTGLSAPAPAGSQTSTETYIESSGFRSIQRVTYNYSIRTSKEGTFTIPPAMVTLNGKTYETEPVRLRVQGLPQARAVPAELEGLIAPPVVQGEKELQRKLTGGIFILPVLTKNEPYNGEQVRISYHLVVDPEALTESGLQPNTNLDGIEVPPMNEFIKQELFPFPQRLEFQTRKIGDTLYQVAPIYDALITSTKSGKLQIEPFRISMHFTKRGGQRRQQLPPPFADDPFFSSLAPFGMGGSSVRVIAQSPLLTLDVKPLPTAGQPAGFDNAVGQFTVDAEVDKKQARAYDDTIELKLKIEGEGNTESLSAPALPKMPGFTVLGNPTAKVEGSRQNDKYVSSKTFTYTLRPTTQGKQEIPVIPFSYFDPETEQYEAAKTDAIPMEIAPGTRPVPPPVPETEPGQPQENAPQPEADLRYISTDTLKAPPSALARLWGPLGAVLFLLPPLLVSAAGFVTVSRKKAAEEERSFKKQLDSAAAQHLKAASNAVAANDSKAMAAELAQGMRLHFAARFGISVGEATIPEIEERLGRAGAPAAIVSGITHVLETCDTAQYAPSAHLGTSAQEFHDEAVQLLNQTEAFV